MIDPLRVEVVTTAQYCEPSQVKDKTVVVIDVLRAATVMTTALENGARSVITKLTKDEVQAEISRIGFNQVVTGGERKALKIEGFDFGNSPLDYTSSHVKGKDVLLTTTNGTVAIQNAASAKQVIIACFRNAPAVAEYLASHTEQVVLVCAGTNGRFSLDDSLCAGMLIHLMKSKIKVECDDLGILLDGFYSENAGDIFNAIQDCLHVKRLKALGFYDDLEFCLQTGCSICIPVERNGKFVRLG